MARLPFRIPFFRIFYSTTYTSLFFILLVLLAITPTSLIFSAIVANAYQYTLVVGGVYVLTAIFTILIYSSRLYTNRSVLAAVGKSWIPVEKGEVTEKVRKIVVRSLVYSALISWESRPKDLTQELGGRDTDEAKEQHALMKEDSDMNIGKVIKFDPRSPPWGQIQHRGWSSPAKADTTVQPHLYYTTVIQELPNLIEARVVSLAAQSRTSSNTTSTNLTQLNPNAAIALQRPPTAGLRAYLNQLDGLDDVVVPGNAEGFLHLYEHARFSGKPLLESEFTALMTAFADLLAGIIFTTDGPSADPSNHDSSSRSHSVASAGTGQSAIHHRPTSNHVSSPPLPSTRTMPFMSPLQSPDLPPSLRQQSSMSSTLKSPQPTRDSHPRRSLSLRSTSSVIHSARPLEINRSSLPWHRGDG